MTIKNTGKIKIVQNVSLGLAVFLAFSAVAQEQVPRFKNIFGSNMVLPHDEMIVLSGYGTPGEELSLEVDNSTYEVNVDQDGSWQAEIQPLAAGGPYEIALSGAEGLVTTLDNVLAGNVWLCSGQSNMAYSVSASVDQPAEYNQGHSSIRLLTVATRTDLQPLDEFGDDNAWQEATDITVPRFSAVCYFFARKMYEENGIPLGLINASWGGSAIEAWIGTNGLMQVPEFRRKITQLEQYQQDQRAAELDFAAQWVEWWHSVSDQGAVWEQGVLDTARDWRDAPLVNWKTYPDERMQDHHGVIWFSSSFELTAEQAEKQGTFILGEVDEVDSTWLNGEFVNNTFGYGTRREYPLESGVLQPGINQFTVNILNTWDAGGMTGPAEDVGILFDDGEFVPLGESWKYLFIPREAGWPPRSPWETVSGITGMFNAMIAPIAPLAPSGTIWYQGESNAESSDTYGALLEALVSDWRTYFDSEFPLIVVQLPNYGSVPQEPAESGWAAIRHAQQQVAVHDPQVGLVVTHDVGNDIDIHPRQKFVVGERAAEVALALRSGEGVANGVLPQLATYNSQWATLKFSPSLAPVNTETQIEGFSLCSASWETCRFTEAVQEGSEVRVSMQGFPAATIRFCWADGGQCSLVAENGLPVSSFEFPMP